jgi:cell shape-determining protein MreD
MAVLVAIPILSILLIVQMTVVSQFPLLLGVPDLVLVALLAWTMQRAVKTAWQWALIGAALLTYASAMPPGVYLVGYLAAVGVALALKQRVWRGPLLAMFVATFVGTILVHLAMIITLRIQDTPFSFWEAFNLAALPSVLLNLVLAAPFFGLFSELADYLHPEELEV